MQDRQREWGSDLRGQNPETRSPGLATRSAAAEAKTNSADDIEAQAGILELAGGPASPVAAAERAEYALHAQRSAGCRPCKSTTGPDAADADAIIAVEADADTFGVSSTKRARPRRRGWQPVRAMRPAVVPGDAAADWQDGDSVGDDAAPCRASLTIAVSARIGSSAPRLRRKPEPPTLRSIHGGYAGHLEVDQIEVFGVLHE